MPGAIPAIPLIDSLKAKLETVEGVSQESLDRAEHASCMAEKGAVEKGGEVVVSKSVALIAFLVKAEHLDLPEDFIESLEIDSSLKAKISSTLSEVLSETPSENLETEIVLEALKQ